MIRRAARSSITAIAAAAGTMGATRDQAKRAA